MKSALEELQAVIERLTDAENGCPWDKEQTPESLTEYLIEESHELVSAIRSGNTADVCEELGDVAFLLLFVAHLYQKRGQFSLDDALNNNRAKMVRRHPHVFGDVTFDNLDEQLKTWEKIKRAEHTDAEGTGEDYRMMILPDHPTPICVRTHTSDPIPYLLYDSRKAFEDGAGVYNEKAAKAGGIEVMHGYELIDKLFDCVRGAPCTSTTGD